MISTANPTAQLASQLARIWSDLRRDAGYQPFGFDRPTLAAAWPEYYRQITRLESEIYASERALLSAGLHSSQHGARFPLR